jgi:alpha-amylase/alpha-mannosidase (GH57 family)
VDIITTPYYHPILPLVYDTDLAAICQPGDPLPGRYSYPDDAEGHVVKAVKMYNEIFGTPPTGMWPGEGSIAQPVLEILRRHGILWTAGDVKVLQRSRPEGQPNTTPYQFPAGKEPISIVFRDTELSDRIGFKYQSYEGEIAAEDFVRSILAFAPRKEEKDVLVTVILDGENAWEWYQKDIDGKSFLHALYRKLTALYRDRQVVTTTMIEYLRGNPARGIPAHPVELQPRMEWLWPGSWINGNFDTWIGEDEENAAWEYLRRTREDLARSGVPRPDPHDAPPPANTPAWYAHMAWEEMYASEGSDWFWWYGRDQSAPGGDHPFDTSFRVHLRNVYRFARLAGAKMDMPEFPAIIAAGAGAEISGSADGRGTMARGSGETRRVVFHCDARAEHVPAGIFIVGNHELLGSWKPNTVLMRDDGLEEDQHAGDGMWSFAVDLPVDADIHYKFTNSGVSGQWTGEEFPLRHRTVRVTRADAPLHIRDQFGK